MPTHNYKGWLATEFEAEVELSNLIDAYNACNCESKKYLTNYFMEWLDLDFPDSSPFLSSLRSATLSGYFLRCAEEIMDTRKVVEPDPNVKTLLSSDNSRAVVIQSIARYLGNTLHTEPSKGLTDTSKRLLKLIVEDALGHVGMVDERKDQALVIPYRHGAFGYVWRLSEELVSEYEAKMQQGSSDSKKKF